MDDLFHCELDSAIKGCAKHEDYKKLIAWSHHYLKTEFEYLNRDIMSEGERVYVRDAYNCIFSIRYSRWPEPKSCIHSKREARMYARKVRYIANSRYKSLPLEDERNVSYFILMALYENLLVPTRKSHAIKSMKYISNAKVLLRLRDRMSYLSSDEMTDEIRKLGYGVQLRYRLAQLESLVTLKVTNDQTYDIL